MRRATAMLAAAVLLAAGPALAHTDEYLDTVKAPHGGQLRMAGALHIELVLDARDGAESERLLTVYITDHADAPQATAGARGTLVLLSRGAKVKAELLPAGGHRMQARARFAPVPDMKVVVGVALAGQPPALARFTPLRPKAAAGAAGADANRK